jgi:hypothetical protein
MVRLLCTACLYRCTSTACVSTALYLIHSDSSEGPEYIVYLFLVVQVHPPIRPLSHCTFLRLGGSQRV